MIDILEYEYDEVLYEARLQKLLQRSRKNIADREKATYDNIDKLDLENKRLQRQMENLISELQVEHFLMVGPQGKDPD